MGLCVVAPCGGGSLYGTAERGQAAPPHRSPPARPPAHPQEALNTWCGQFLSQNGFTNPGAPANTVYPDTVGHRAGCRAQRTRCTQRGSACGAAAPPQPTMAPPALHPSPPPPADLPRGNHCPGAVHGGAEVCARRHDSLHALPAGAQWARAGRQAWRCWWLRAAGLRRSALQAGRAAWHARRGAHEHSGVPTAAAPLALPQVSVSGQALVFVVRTVRHSLLSKAGPLTYVAFAVAQVRWGGAGGRHRLPSRRRAISSLHSYPLLDP